MLNILKEEKKLVEFLANKLVKGKKKKFAGRNNQGFITVRHQGGQCDRQYRIINFTYFYWNCYGIILKFSYDPNRTAPIMLLCYLNGILSCHLAVKNLKVGDLFYIGNINNEVKHILNRTSYFSNITEGSLISNISHLKNKGTQFVRAAGTSAQLLKIDNVKKKVLLRLPSKEERLVDLDAICTLGQVANINHFFFSISTAGRNRLLGKRPTVRGVAMNPVDHPHGGGQGKTSGAGGFRSQVTFKGRVAKTQPTRNPSKNNIFILKTKRH
jgi:large subunit ribosomal protein L2